MADTLTIPKRMAALQLDKHGRLVAWRPVAGFEGLYEVSGGGHVRSLRGGRILRPYVHTQYGHHRVTLQQRGQRLRCMVHVLVLEAFVGSRPPGQCGRHLDGDPANNAVENLAWGSMRENHADRERHGRTARGERNGNAKVSDAQIADIRQAMTRGESQRSLAARYGVHVSTIWRIVHNRRNRRSR